jgi:hypothetical protein
LKVVVAVEDGRVVFAANVASLAASCWSIVVVGATGSDWRAANVGADIVQVLAAATVRHALGRWDPVLDTVTDQEDLNLLGRSAGGGSRWASRRNGTIDARFTRPEIGIV